MGLISALFLVMTGKVTVGLVESNTAMCTVEYVNLYLYLSGVQLH